VSSRLTRMLLKLYPRRIRDRYGDELLDLQDELRGQGDLSRMRLIRDMLAGAFLVRSARRAYLMMGAALLIGGLGFVGTKVGGRGTESPARASHPQVRLAVPSATASPYRSCLAAGGSSCSLTPCAEFTGQPSAGGAVGYSILPARRSRPHGAATGCAAYPHVRRQRPVFVSQ
jgi:hypothetical protein